jgi:TM2 domain-containing membrane protein YozV/cold shock CspA family protein
MRGKVLEFDVAGGTGVISGDDGKRYPFSRADLGGGVTALIPGRDVDFEVGGDGRATSVFSLAASGGLSGDKNKLIAGLLGIFLGGLGIHKFYLGKKGPALIMLIGSLAGIVLFAIPTLIIGIIGFIEGIIYLVKDEQKFHEDYVAGNRNWF